MLLLSWSAHSKDLMKQIMRNKPGISKVYAGLLAREIRLVSKKYDIPADIFCAIIAQESKYKLDTVNTITGIYKGQETKVEIDFGLTQINWRNVKRHKFNTKKLKSDVKYSLNAGAFMLAQFKKSHGKKESNWWSRYYSGNKIKRSEYEKLVGRYL